VQAAEPIGFVKVFTKLQNPDLTKEERREVFDALLKTPGGPFMDSHLPMRGSVRNLARHVTERELRNMNLPSSCVDPNDVAHDAIIVFLEHCSKIRDPRKLKSWLWSVMQKMVLKELGKDRAFVETTDLSLVDREQQTPSNTIEEESDDTLPNPRVDALHAALDELPASLRAVVILHGIEGHSHAETAQMLGIEPTAVRVRWFRAKRVLRRKLTEQVRLAS